MSKTTSKKRPARKPAEPAAAKAETKTNPEVPFEEQVKRIVDRRIAQTLQDVAQNMQHYFGLNVVGAEMQATAKRLEDGRLK